MIALLYLLGIAGLVTLLIIGCVVCQTRNEVRDAGLAAEHAARAASGNSLSLNDLHVRLDTHTATRATAQGHLRLIVNEEATDGMGGEDAEWPVARRLPRHRRHEAIRER